MSIITITKDNFQREVMSSRKPVLMDFLGALVRPVQKCCRRWWRKSQRKRTTSR